MYNNLYACNYCTVSCCDGQCKVTSIFFYLVKMSIMIIISNLSFSISGSRVISSVKFENCFDDFLLSCYLQDTFIIFF